MTNLSVNINKIATLRNARGGNNPNVIKAALAIERFGAAGITVHPRPDQRHITYKDVSDLKNALSTEFNIEGNPTEDDFGKLVLANTPTQVTLVPDARGQLTSNHGWDTVQHQEYLKYIIGIFKNAGIRVSIFVDANEKMIAAAATTGTDRIELYTESYARQWAECSLRLANGSGQVEENKEELAIGNLQLAAVQPFAKAALQAHSLGLGINAGHDLDLQNLQFFAQHVPHLLEVSIGHALISDALYLGLENAVQLYKRQLS